MLHSRYSRNTICMFMHLHVLPKVGIVLIQNIKIVVMEKIYLKKILFFMARLTIVRGPYVFALSVRPSVRPWGSKIFFCLKTRFMGFWEGLGCFWRFRFLSVRACVRACVTLYVLSFVGWTCPRVLVRSTWNLFRSTIYELKLCTSYFWSTSVRPFVRQNGRNIASHTGLLVIYFQSCGLNLS